MPKTRILINLRGYARALLQNNPEAFHTKDSDFLTNPEYLAICQACLEQKLNDLNPASTDTVSQLQQEIKHAKSLEALLNHALVSRIEQLTLIPSQTIKAKLHDIRPVDEPQKGSSSSNTNTP